MMNEKDINIVGNTEETFEEKQEKGARKLFWCQIIRVEGYMGFMWETLPKEVKTIYYDFWLALHLAETMIKNPKGA